MTEVFARRTAETTRSHETGAKSGPAETDPRAISHREKLRAKLRQELRNEVTVADPLYFMQRWFSNKKKRVAKGTSSGE